jgi:hypothetical protein
LVPLGHSPPPRGITDFNLIAEVGGHGRRQTPFRRFRGFVFKPRLNVSNWAAFSFDVNAFDNPADIAGFGDG